jgi:cytochrome P450
MVSGTEAGDTFTFDPDVDGFDPFADDVMNDPYPYYAVLRERCPVHHNSRTDMYFLSHYQDVAEIDPDNHRFIRGDSVSGIYDTAYAGTSASQLFRNTLFALDEPDHSRLKRLIGKAFARSRVDSLRPRIEQLADEILDEAALQPEGGVFELVTTLGYPLSFRVICEVLGIPDDDDRTKFLKWARDLTPTADMFPTDDVARRGIEACATLTGYLTALIGQRRRDIRAGMPTPPGLVTELVALAEEGEKIDSAELLTMCATIVVVGFENVTNLISVAVRALTENPDQIAALRRDPRLFSNLPDEAVRYYSTTQYTIRQTTEEITVHDTVIPAGAHVVLLRGSANRDENRFEQANRFDLSRPDNKHHVGFGAGATFCTGAQLARVEVEVAVQKLLDRVSDIRIVGWTPGAAKLMWGPGKLMIEYGSARNPQPAVQTNVHNGM